MLWASLGWPVWNFEIAPGSRNRFELNSKQSFLRLAPIDAAVSKSTEAPSEEPLVGSRPGCLQLAPEDPVSLDRRQPEEDASDEAER